MIPPNDAYVHFVSGGMQLDNILLNDATTPEEFARHIGACEIRAVPSRPRSRPLQQAGTRTSHTAKTIYRCVAGFALKMPLKFSRYCRKTRIHNTQATSAGAMPSGAIVRWKARML